MRARPWGAGVWAPSSGVDERTLSWAHSPWNTDLLRVCVCVHTGDYKCVLRGLIPFWGNDTEVGEGTSPILQPPPLALL